MAAEGEKNGDFYAIMGLKKECTTDELRNAYKKLAMKWHPDRCCASGNLKYLGEAKKDSKPFSTHILVIGSPKRFLYDIGFYDCNDDDDENGMGDFLSEMAAMMKQNKSNDNRNESFEDLQELFEDIFHSDTNTFGSSSSRSATPPTCILSQDSCSGTHSTSNKRDSSHMSPSYFITEATQFEAFSIGTGGTRTSGKQQVGESNRKRNTKKGRREGTKQRIVTGHDLSSSTL